jgi:hypothetical protein
LPSRLKALAPTTFDSPLTTHATLPSGFQYTNREVVTTASFSLPVPMGPVPPHLRTLVEQEPDGTTEPIVSPSLAQLMRARLVAGGAANPDTDLQLLLAPELRRGEKLDLNRILGNGQDDDNDMVVDTAENNPLWQVNAPDYTHGDATVGSPQELFARHLYALAMLVTNHTPDANGATFPMPYQGTNVDPRTYARRMAQWCVNVVDFRDPDAVMTRFEFDVNPFNGWKNVPAEVAVVWGCEAPELLITETLAMHDKRVADTDRDDGSGDNFGPPGKRLGPDQDNDGQPDENDVTLDQEAIPQGSLFVELFCTRSPVPPTAQMSSMAPVDALKGLLPAELYSLPAVPQQSQQFGLNLAAVAPPTSAGRVLPVWRLAISTSQVQRDANGNVTHRADRPLENWRKTPDTFIPEPAPVDYDRYVWFTNAVPPSEPDRHRIFYNHMLGYERPAAEPVPQPVLTPGRYAVVAPRVTTPFGLLVEEPGVDPPKRTAARQKLDFNSTVTLIDTPPSSPSNVQQFATSGSLSQADVQSRGRARRPLVLISTADPPGTTWGDYRIGLNVSEPLPSTNTYYPKPKVLSGEHKGFYGFPYNPIDQIPDMPLDFNINTPLGKDKLYAVGTYEQYRTVYLQRLANPKQPWDATLNPYITVDFATVDLTVMNGHDVIPDGWDDTTYGPFDQNPDDTFPGNSAAEELDRFGRHSTRWRHATFGRIGQPRLSKPRIARARPAKISEFGTK